MKTRAEKTASERARRAGNDAYKEMRREYMRAYRKAQPDKTRAVEARRRQRHAEAIAGKGRAYHAKNAPRIRARAAAWHQQNPDRVRIHKVNRRARVRGNGGSLSAGLRQKLFQLQRGLCACCGAPLGKRFHMDHIMPLALGGENVDSNMQLLTGTCNSRKRAKHPVLYMQERGMLL